jgi:hypothetical protein
MEGAPDRSRPASARRRTGLGAPDVGTRPIAEPGAVRRDAGARRTGLRAAVCRASVGRTPGGTGVPHPVREIAGLEASVHTSPRC